MAVQPDLGIGSSPIAASPISGSGPSQSFETITFDRGAFEQTAFVTARDYLISAGAGDLLLSGNDASLFTARSFTASSETYSLAGQDAAIQFSRVLNVDPAIYVQTGYAVLDVVGGPVESTSYLLNGNPIRFFKSSFYYSDTEIIYVPEELRGMLVSAEVYFGVTNKSAMLVDAESQVLYVPAKDLSLSDLANTALQTEPRQRAVA